MWEYKCHQKVSYQLCTIVCNFRPIGESANSRKVKIRNPPPKKKVDPPPEGDVGTEQPPVGASK